jgi:tetratricopeptide (TPR) repeat protein
MLFWLSVANLAKGDQAEADRQLALFEEELRRKGVADVVISMNVGFIHLKAGRTALAVPRMEQAVAENPDFFSGVSWLATMLADAGQPDRAAACLQRFLEAHPGNREARIDLAKITAAGGLDLAAAVAELEQMRGSAPDLVNAEFLRVLGDAYLALERPDRAVRTLEEAWDLLPQYDHRTHESLAAARKALGRSPL